MANLTKERAISKLQRLIDKALSITHLNTDDPEFKIWRRDTETALQRIFGEGSPNVNYFLEIRYFNLYKLPREGYQEGLREASIFLQSMLEDVQDYWNDTPEINIEKLENVKVEEPTIKTPCVFIGHGRNPLWARLQLFLEKQLGLKTVNYESESRIGEAIIPVLEKMLSQATFAVLILTAEDEITGGVKRARQNVIHEAGLFQGKLGFKKAILLKQEGTEDFSNVAGLQYIPFIGDSLEQTFWKLQEVLKREGQLS